VNANTLFERLHNARKKGLGRLDGAGLALVVLRLGVFYNACDGGEMRFGGDGHLMTDWLAGFQLQL
jgi:hypothetical protein